MITLAKLASPAIAAALSLAAAMPAQARDFGPSYQDDAPSGRYMDDFRHGGMPAKRFGHFGFRARIADLQRDIDRAAAMHRISWREAESLSFEANRLKRLHWSFSRDGLNGWEMEKLDRKIAKLRMALRYEKRDADHRRF